MPSTLGSLVESGWLTFSDGYRTKKSELSNSGFRILRAGDISGGAARFTGPDFVDAKRTSAIGHKFVRRGDVVLTTKGTVGRTAYVAEDAPPAVYSPQLCFFRTNAAHLDARYLYYWFSSNEFIRQADSMKSSTDMAPYISLAQLAHTTITIAPLRYQQAIAEVLSSLDDKITANNRNAETSTSLAAALTARAMAAAHPVPLHEVASLTMGQSPQGSSYNVAGEGLPLFQGMGDFGPRWPKVLRWTTEPTRTAASGDLLLSVRAPVGALNRADGDCCIGRGLAALRSATPHALFHLLRNQADVFGEYNSSGTIFGSINKAQLSNLEVHIPDSGIKNLESQLRPFEEVAAAMVRESSTLAELRDTLLPALMDGRLRVRDAVKQAEEVL